MLLNRAQVPQCCHSTPLQLPRPDFATIRFSSLEHAAWDHGISDWGSELGVAWQDPEEIASRVHDHLGRRLSAHSLDTALAAHGVKGDSQDDVAWIGFQSFSLVRLHSQPNQAAGRGLIVTARDLLNAMDAHSADMVDLVAPLVNLGAGEFWSEEVLRDWPDAFTANTLVLLNVGELNPLLRGQRLGAWHAARCVAEFDDGNTLFATYASSTETDPSSESTDELSTRRRASASSRLADYWRRAIGFESLKNSPPVLAYHSAHTNLRLENTLRLWSS